jgi:hypothetical protein
MSSTLRLPTSSRSLIAWSSLHRFQCLRLYIPIETQVCLVCVSLSLSLCLTCVLTRYVSMHVASVVIDNNRHIQLHFTAKMTGTMHGFVGYFDATLYKDVHCSILPATYSDSMFSWFPIYFPLRVCVVFQPLYMSTGSASLTSTLHLPDANPHRTGTTYRGQLLAQLHTGQGLV